MNNEFCIAGVNCRAGYATVWNEESLMVYDLERKQKELKCLHEYLLR